MRNYPDGVQLAGYRERWFAAAGSLGFDGFDSGHPPLVRAWKLPFRAGGRLDPRRFTIISKTLTLGPRKGNLTDWTFWRAAWPLRPLSRRSMVNCVALTNPGLAAWLASDLPRAVRRGVRMVASVQPSSVDEAADMAQMILPHAGRLAGIQVNACPNVAASGADEYVEILTVMSRCGLPLLAKLGYSEHLYNTVAKLDGMVTGVEVINAVPWAYLRGGVSPLSRYGYEGSVSGGDIAPVARLALTVASKALPGGCTKLISGGGMVSRPEAGCKYTLWAEAFTRFTLGASAVSFATAFLWEPWNPGRVADSIDRLFGKESS